MRTLSLSPPRACCPQKPNSVVTVVLLALREVLLAASFGGEMGPGNRGSPADAPAPPGSPICDCRPCHSCSCAREKVFFFPICLLRKPPRLGTLRVECGSSLLVSQSLWSHSAAECSALGNKPCCRLLPCGWFSTLSTWRGFLGGAHPPSSSDGTKQNSLTQLSPWRAWSTHLSCEPAGTSCLLSLQSSVFLRNA